MSLARGARLGPYVIESLIGAGGMGEVYRATDPRLGRVVAIKVLSAEVATPERVERFEQEARAASALNHPNILTVHDVGREGTASYLAMEWVDGQTLRDLIRQGRVPLRRAIDLAHQAAEGLAKAHAAGIVHRDLKPENVMVTADGFLKIVDFGIAKLSAGRAEAGRDPEAAATATHAGATAAGVVLGTVGYLSPEQAAGLAVDYRSDQFALGLLIYELVTGSRPFARPTTAQSMAATIEAEPAPIESLNPDVPPHLAAVVARCLAKHPAERYDSTRDLARDLGSILDTKSRTSVTLHDRRPPVPRWAWAAGGLVLLLGAIGVAAWMWRGRTPAAAPTHPLVAVRPFRSLSPDPQLGYFAAGMTDEIRGQLSQVASLRLLSRNGLDAYKDGDVSRAARELGVGSVVDGSVRVEGDRVRVSAELVDASSQQTLWSDQYDRSLADVLGVQSDIATQIAHALRASLTPREQRRLERRPTENVEAYSLYLKSQQLGSIDRARNLEAIELLRRALVLDPRFVDAQSRMAYRLAFMSTYDEPSYVDKGMAEAQAALRIDPAHPYAYFVLGTAYAMKGRDAQSRQAFLRALELDPNNGSAMANFSVAESQFGRLDDSAYWGRRLFGISGQRGNDYYHLILPLMDLRADAVSRTLLDEAVRRYPTFPRAQMLLSELELLEGRHDRALSLAERLVAAEPGNEEVKFKRADVAFLLDAPDLERWLEPLMSQSAANQLMVPETTRLKYAYALAKRGDAQRAAALIAEAESVARKRIDGGDETPGLRVELAAAAALRKDANAALDWLAQAHQSGYRDYGYLEKDPILASLRSDARFSAVIDRMRRDVDAQRARAAERGLLDVAGLVPTAK